MFLNRALFNVRDIFVIGLIAIVVHVLVSPIYDSIDNKGNSQ